MIWSNYDYSESATLGDNLADYIDAGGGVYCDVRDWSLVFCSPNRSLSGRFATDDYSVIDSPDDYVVGYSTAGTVYDADHVMVGVTALSAGSVFRPQSGLHPDATKIVDWEDGSYLAAVREMEVVYGEWILVCSLHLQTLVVLIGIQLRRMVQS